MRVAEQDLHHAGVDAVLQQAGGVGMSQGMRRDGGRQSPATATAAAKLNRKTRSSTGASPR